VQAYVGGILPSTILCDWVTVVDPGKTNMIIYVNSMLNSYQICLPDIHILGHNKASRVNSELSSQTNIIPASI
jgi:hypothetical protein